MRRAFAVARALGLSDTERAELANLLPGIDAGTGRVSWSVLDVDQLAHLVTWLEGARLVRDLMRLRG